MKHFFCIIINLFFLQANALQINKKIEFNIGVLQPFLSEDTQDSYLYKGAFEAALFFNLGMFAEKFKKCGYLPKYQFQYFPHEDTPKLKSLAMKLENEKNWFILGPNKSEQFLNAARVIKKTVMISGMANSKEIYELNWPFYTIYPSNQILAKATYFWVHKNKEYIGNYGVITDPSCTFCEDFKNNYINYAGNPSFVYEISEELFNSNFLKKQIDKYSITSLLLPVYSSFSGKIISSLNKEPYSKIKFIANDGLGDELNHVSYYPISKEQKGFSIRLGPKKSETIKILNIENLSLSWNDIDLYPPDEAIYFKESLEKILNILCKNKPMNKVEFNEILKKQPKDFFQSDLNFGVFELSGKKFFFKEILNKNI